MGEADKRVVIAGDIWNSAVSTKTVVFDHVDTEMRLWFIINTSKGKVDKMSVERWVIVVRHDLRVAGDEISKRHILEV